MNNNQEEVTIAAELVEDKDKNEIIISSEKNTAIKENNSSRFFKTGRLQEFLDKIKSLFIQEGFWPKIFILILMYILGILHAFESGHGKGILVSYLVEHDKGKKEALIFSTVMTITHLADVIILSLIFKLLSLSGNVYNYINGLQKFGAYVLIVMAIYYLIKNFVPRDEYVSKSSSVEKASILAFIAGLAPCTIGWAIMIILLSIGKIGWIIPVIIVFGLGIWTTLLVFSFVIIELKNRYVSRLKYFSKISAILSAILLLAVGVIILV